MKKEASLIRDIVLPLDYYPQVNQGKTLQDAIQTITEFRKQQHGYLRYAGLLVVNDKGGWAVSSTCA